MTLRWTGQSDQWQCHDYYPPFMFNNSANLTVPRNVGANKQSCGARDLLPFAPPHQFIAEPIFRL